MIDATQAGVDRTILLAEFMSPVRVVGKGSDEKCCCRYPVIVSAPNGTQTRMVLLEFDCDGNSLHKFETAASMLNRLQNMSVQMPRYWVYGNHPKHRYILIDADPLDFLSLQDLAKKPLRDRLDILCELLSQAVQLQEQGILLRDSSWSRIRCWKGQYRFWDYTGVLLRQDVTEAVWTNSQCTANAAMAKLVYQGILGQDLPTADLKPNLTILLCHMADSKGISAFCDTLNGFLSQTEVPGLGRLLEDLHILRKFGPEPGQENGWETWQIVADFLHRNPLYPYVRKNDSGDSLLKVVLFGRSELRGAFFSQILSAAQILDNRLHLHIIAPDASEFWMECRSRAPMLERVILVNGDGSALEPEITGHNARGEVAPLAELTLEATAQFSPNALCQDGTGCLLLLEPYNDTVSFQICDLVNRTEERLLVGICQDRPLNENATGKNQLTDLRSFRSGGTGRFEDTGIYQKALDLHVYYEKHYDQRISQDRILENFHSEKNNHYNLRSSVRSALSIPYKLCSNEPDPAWFHREILEKKDQLLYRLIWLEHRSWQAHLILDGWQLNHDAFGDGLINNSFVQKNDQEKWHACLRGSDDTGCLPLTDWDWEKGDLSGLDPLDRMSVEIHRSLTEKVRRHQDDLNACLGKLKSHLPPAQYQQVQNSVKQLREQVTNAEVGWARTCDELSWDKSDGKLGPDIKNLLTLARELIDRNTRRDYKKIDQSIIEAIPYLERKKHIRHIYSLCAEHPWNNVAVAMLLAPETLTLVSNGQHEITDEALRHCATFLRDRRNLKIEISKCRWNELTECPDDAVLDVTGADVDQILMVQSHPWLKSLPMIAYRDGALVSPNGSCDAVRFYPKNHSITVEEMMSLTGTTVLSEYGDIPMHGMYRYQELWAAMQEMSLLPRNTGSKNKDDNDYHAVTNYLSALRNKQTWAIKKAHPEIKLNIPEDIAEKTGFCDLLEQLKRVGLIAQTSTYDLIQPAYTDFYENLRSTLQNVEEIIRKSAKAEKIPFLLTEKDNAWKIQYGDSEQDRITIKKAARTYWQTGYSEAEARGNGLLTVLEQLQRNRIIQAFHFANAPGNKTEIRAEAPENQDTLNQLLDAYDKAIADHRVEKMHLDLEPEDPANACVLEDRELVVRQESVKGSDLKLPAGHMKSVFEILERHGLIRSIGNVPILTNTQQKVGTLKIYDLQFEYADYATKECLTKEGNALEALTYHTIRNMNIFDDVKLSTRILWDRQNVNGRDTVNEIDVICTKGMRSFFISCKQCIKLDKLQFNEVLYEAERFGIEGIPILVSTAKRSNFPSEYVRAERMGIHIITLTRNLFHKDQSTDTGKELEDQLRAILKKVL